MARVRLGGLAGEREGGGRRVEEERRRGRCARVLLEERRGEVDGARGARTAALTRALTAGGNTLVMRITTKGQVTIPQKIRDELGLLPNTEVTVDIVGGEARLRRATAKPKERSKRVPRGDGVVAHLRSVIPSNKLTTDEIMSLMRGKP